MTLKHCFLLIAALIAIVATKGQERRGVYGTVKDESGYPVPHASVTLMQADSTIMAFTSTTAEGSFHLVTSGVDESILCVSMLGFKQSCVVVDRADHNAPLDFILTRERTVLQEVNVHAWAAIRERGDTTIYRLDAFTNETERNLEEALAKLPGFRVDESGTISVNGKNITKINIEDDDLVGTDYQMLSKNLSADIVEDVEVLGGYLDNPLFKGIVASEEIALNLRLKDKRNKMLFGTLEAAGGPRGKYDGTANGILLTKALKGYLLAKGNNAGFEVSQPTLTRTTDVTISGSPFNPMPANAELLAIGTAAVPSINSQRNVFNNGRLGSLNVVGTPVDKLSIRGNLHVYADGNRVASNTLSQYFSQDDTTVFDESKAYHNAPFQWAGNLEMSYPISQNSLLKLTYGGRSLESRGNASIALNDLAVRQYLDGTQNYHRMHLDYTNRVAGTSLLQIQSIYLKNVLGQQLMIPQYTHADGSERFDYPMRQDYRSPFESIATQVKWAGNFAGVFTYGITADYQYQKEQLRSELFENGNVSTAEDLNFSNQYSRNTHQISVGLQGRLQVGRIRLTGNMAVNHDIALLQNKLDAPAGFDQRVFYLSPNIAVRWSFARRHNLTFNYAYNRHLTPLRNLYNSYIFTNYLNARRYETIPYQLTNQTVGMRYTYRYPFRQFFANVYAYHGVTNNALRSNILYDPVYFFSSAYPNDKSLPFSGVRVGVDKLLSKLNLLTSFTSNVTRYQYINRVNTAADRTVNAISMTNEVSFTSTFAVPYNTTLRIRNAVHFNRVEVDRRKQWNRRSNWLVAWQNTLKVGKDFMIHQSLEHYRWMGRDERPSYHTTFFDGGAEWDIMHDKLSVTANIRNALNRQQLVFINVSDYSEVRRDFTLQPRIILVGAKYRF